MDFEKLRLKILTKYLIYLETYIGACIVNWIDPLHDLLYDTHEKWEKKLKERNDICPICLGYNKCAIENGEDPKTCWCMTAEMPKNLPKYNSCVCQKCSESMVKNEKIVEKFRGMFHVV